jgi:hypothetical protein
LIATALATGVLVVAQAASSAGTAQTFTDPTGDQEQTAPDISTVVVGNTGSQVTWRINVTNQDQLAANSEILLLIDTDKNPNTGSIDSLGAEYLFEVMPNSQYDFYRWDGAQWDDNIPYSTVHVTYSKGATISVGTSELGGTKGVNFWARGLQDVGGGNVAVDDAPNDGTWSFDLQGASANVGIASMTVVAAGQAKAGKVFRLKVPLVTLLTGKQVPPDSYACQATLGGRPFGGTACRWKFPRSARGKRLAVRITAVYHGARKTVDFSTKIK